MSQRTRARTTGAAARPTDSTSSSTSSRSAPAESAPNSASPTHAESVGAGDAPTPRRGKRASAAANVAATTRPAPDVQEQTQAASLPLQPDALARALRAVATELERDPALAQRVAQAINAPSTSPAAGGVESAGARAAQPEASEAPAEPIEATIGRSFHPTIVTGIAEELGPGVPDPFALRQRLGEPGLREALATLRLGSLRAIIRQHGLDPAGNIGKVNDAEKLRAHILAATRKGKR